MDPNNNNENVFVDDGEEVLFVDEEDEPTPETFGAGTAPGELGGGDEFLFAAAEDFTHLESLLKVNVFTRLHVFAERVSGKKLPTTIEAMSAAQFKLFMGRAMSSGFEGSATQQVGSYDKKGAQVCMEASVAGLITSLRPIKVAPPQCHTDRTISRLIADVAGVVVEAQPNGGARIYIPEYNPKGRDDSRTILVDGDEHQARIVTGARDYVNYLNTYKKANIRFKEMNFTAVRLAMIIQNVWNVRASSKLFQAGINPNNKTKFNRHHEKIAATMVDKVLPKWFEDPRNEVNITVPKQERTAVYLEWALTCAIEAMSEANLNGLEGIMQRGDNENSNLPADAVRDATILTGRNYHLSPVVPIIEKKLDTYMDAHNAVQQFRTMRPGDVMRKSDAPNITSFADGASSVPAKYGAALSALATVVALDNAQVDAYGVHASNHWAETLMEKFRTRERDGVTLRFRDIDDSSKAPMLPGGKAVLEVGPNYDVMQLAPNSGRGRVIMDDTDARRRIDTGKGSALISDYHAKAASIVRARYEGGVVKMYLGCNSVHVRSDDQIGQVPSEVQEFLRHYPYVAFSPGGSYHTQEYLLVFGGGWHEDRATAKVCVYPPGGAPERVGSLIDRPDGYVDASTTYWKKTMVKKYLDMIRSNILIYYRIKSLNPSLSPVAGEKRFPTFQIPIECHSLVITGKSPLSTTNLGAIPDIKDGEFEVIDDLDD